MSQQYWDLSLLNMLVMSKSIMGTRGTVVYVLLVVMATLSGMSLPAKYVKKRQKKFSRV